VLALLIVHILAPNLEVADIENKAAA